MPHSTVHSGASNGPGEPEPEGSQVLAGLHEFHGSADEPADEQPEPEPEPEAAKPVKAAPRKADK